MLTTLKLERIARSGAARAAAACAARRSPSLRHTTGDKHDDHLYRSGRAGRGRGALASPFAAWTSVSWTPGDTYLQERGSSHAGAFRLGASGTAARPITIGAYAGPDGAAPSPFTAHIQLAFVYGTQTMISNNIFADGTREGIGRGDTSSNIIDVNNVYRGAAFPVPDEDEIAVPTA